MADYIKGEGNIFKNDYKKLDSHPDNKGKIRIPRDLLKLMAEEFKTNVEQAKEVVENAVVSEVSDEPPF